MSDRFERWKQEQEDNPGFTGKRVAVPGGVIRQVLPTCWTVECYWCNKKARAHIPKKLRRATRESQEECLQWLREHLDPDAPHWRYRYPDEKMRERFRAEEEFVRIMRSVGVEL